MDLQCPGRLGGAKDSRPASCPSCGRVTEIFSDEPRVLCRCGAWICSETAPGCFQWCPAADRCAGIVSGGRGPVVGKAVLKPQDNYRQALELAYARASAQPAARLVELGAQPAGENRWTLAVLDGAFLIDLESGRVTVVGPEGETAAREPRLEWRVLALHYLAAPGPCVEPSRWVSFADLPDARGYDPVYRARVLGRLCATAGRDQATFDAACRRLGGEPVPGSGAGYRFRVFPRLSVVITWYPGDDELRPGASFTYPDNVSDFLPAEDVIVLSEGLVGRLQGAGW